jgi:hypothetical protein
MNVGFVSKMQVQHISQLDKKLFRNNRGELRKNTPPVLGGKQPVFSVGDFGQIGQSYQQNQCCCVWEKSFRPKFCFQLFFICFGEKNYEKIFLGKNILHRIYYRIPRYYSSHFLCRNPI